MSAALFDGFAAEKTSHAIFYALRAIKSSHFSNVYFLKKISMKGKKYRRLPSVSYRQSACIVSYLISI